MGLTRTEIETDSNDWSLDEDYTPDDGMDELERSYLVEAEIYNGDDVDW